MASNYNQPSLSDEEVVDEVGEVWVPLLQISRNELPQASSSCPAQSSSLPSHERQIQLHKAPMQDAKLMARDKTTLNLAEYYEEAGNYEEALKYFRKLYEIRRQMLGPKSQSEKITYAVLNIGFCLYEQKKYQQSLQWYRTAITIEEACQRTKDLHHSYNTYALNLMHTGQFDEALEYLKKSLQISNKLTVGDTERKAQVLRNIGFLCLHHISDYTKSLEYWNQALTMYQNMYGRSTPHIEIADCLDSIATAHDKQKNYSRARTYRLGAYNQFKEIYSNEPLHDEIENVTLMLGEECSRMHDYSYAEVYFRELVGIRKAKYGEESRNEKLLHAYRYLIKALKRQNKMEDARELANLLH